MRFVSPALKHVVYPALARTGWLRRSAPQGVSVVTYHGVQPEGYQPLDSALDGNLVSANMFRRQLSLLKANYDVISPEDMRAWLQGTSKLPTRAVLLTCDDGLLNVLTDMLPILLEEGLKCLLFVTGASVADVPTVLWYEELFVAMLHAPAGKFRISATTFALEGEFAGPVQRRGVWWRAVQRLSQENAATRTEFLSAVRQTWPARLRPEDESCPVPQQRRFRLLTRVQLVQLQTSGMTMGAHTLTHPILSRQSAELARHETADSRSALESVLARPAWAFAYPFGDAAAVNPQTLTIARDAGFEAAFLNYGGGFATDFNHFAIPRVHVTSSMELAEFEAHVAGFHARLQRSARKEST